MLVDQAHVAGIHAGSPTAEDWHAVLASDPDALVSQRPEWIDVLCRSGYEDASRLYERADGRRLILPLVRRRSSMPRSLAVMASMPASWGMGGVLAEGGIEQGDVDLVAGDLRRLSSVQVSIRPNPLHAPLWESAIRGTPVVSLARRAHVLDLDGGADAVWSQRFATGARRGVRRAREAGIEVRTGNDPRLLADFRRLFELSVRRWAASQNEPVALAMVRAFRRDPPAKFMHLAAVLPDRVKVWAAYRDGVAIAAIVVLTGADASYTRGAMDKELCGPVRANELLHWLAIQDACATGCRHYHMGETGSSVPLAKFKEKIGARSVPYAEYRFERLPLTRSDAFARGIVKRTIRFKDA